MKTLSVVESAGLLGVPDFASFVARVDWQYADPVPSYFLPKDTGEKVALSRVIANMFMKRGPALLWITETGVWPSSEHPDLFSGYRLAHGESRSVSEAPVHLFETQQDVDAFISVLYLSLSFVWDVEILALDRSLAITISHDEWLEYRFASGQEASVTEFKKWVEPSLRQGAAPAQ